MSEHTTVRTRVAPSPTGSPHIGTAYVALFNYAFARRHGGKFLLRVEDTDRARSTSQSEDEILSALRWLGLSWDEGPDVGGAHGPYRQSERFDVYREHGNGLVARGNAYPCFCTEERLRELRREQVSAKAEFLGYDRKCAGIAPEEARRRAESGEAHVVRLRVPETGDCAMQDRLRGEIRIPWSQVDEQILLKTDGFPTYHLANVVDDHLMDITHVIRGEEWISSLPKHLLLYEAFGWECPEFAHLPLLRNPDKSKLSKRKNPTSILYYRRAGYLPEAMLNFLGLMAYSPADGDENFTLDELCASFDIERVSLGGPVFDLEKLRNFNGRYIRGLAPEELVERLEQWMLNSDTWRAIVPLAQPRLDQLSEFLPTSAFLFGDRLEYDVDLLLQAVEEHARAPELLRIAQWQIEKTADWDSECIKELFLRMSEKEDMKLKKLMPLFFVTFSGSTVSLPVFDSMVLLGRDLCLRRIAYALESLGTRDVALKGKKLKRFTVDYETRYERNER